MYLSPSEIEQWLTVISFVIHFVNQKTETFPEIKSERDLSFISIEKRLTLHNKLYDNISLIDEYLRINPDDLDKEHLRIIAGIKQFKRGTFYIERCLKKHSIFISEDDKVYAVIGIVDPLNEIIPKERLPIMVQATLLPFKDRIIYDGLLRPASIYFGSNIKRELKEIYMAAKQKGAIIETLEKKAIAPTTKINSPNWQPILQDLQKSADKLRSIQTSPALHKPTFALVKASIQLLESVVSNPENYQEAEKSLSKVTRAMKQVEQVIDRQSY